jgi:hypothetical protein
MVPEPRPVIAPIAVVTAPRAPRTLNSSGPRTSTTDASRIGFMNLPGEARVLEHLDAAEAIGQQRDRGRQARPVANVTRRWHRGDALTGEVVGHGLQLRALRATRPMGMPLRPNRRTAGAPRLGSAPTMTIDNVPWSGVFGR